MQFTFSKVYNSNFSTVLVTGNFSGSLTTEDITIGNVTVENLLFGNSSIDDLSIDVSIENLETVNPTTGNSETVNPTTENLTTGNITNNTLYSSSDNMNTGFGISSSNQNVTVPLNSTDPEVLESENTTIDHVIPLIEVLEEENRVQPYAYLLDTTNTSEIPLLSLETDSNVTTNSSFNVSYPNPKAYNQGSPFSEVTPPEPYPVVAVSVCTTIFAVSILFALAVYIKAKRSRKNYVDQSGVMEWNDTSFARQEESDRMAKKIDLV